MQLKVVILSLAALVLLPCLTAADAKFYKDYFSINSRVPGDELVWQSENISQVLDFFATVYVELRYPLDQAQSKYTLTHLLVTGQDDTGYVDFKSETGGPGSDTMRCKIVLNSIQHGYFKGYLYGKKK